MTPALVVADPDRLAQLEAVIASGMQTFLAVGNALLVGCGHSFCSQHYIDTGEVACVAARRTA